MKFDVVAAIVLLTPALVAALPAPQGPDDTPSQATVEPRKTKCAIHVHFEKQWRELAYDRYRVQATAYKNDDDFSEYEMIKTWIDLFYENAEYYPDDFNAQAHRNKNEDGSRKDNSAYGDYNTFIGSRGSYENFNQEVVNAWRDAFEKKCDVNSKWD